jgi:hypothetical protein
MKRTWTIIYSYYITMMSAFEKVEHTRNLARLRQKKYYVLHKGEISIKKGWSKSTPHSSLLTYVRIQDGGT